MHYYSCFNSFSKCLVLWICFSFFFLPSSAAKNIRNRPAGIAVSKINPPADTIRRFQPFLVLALTDTSLTAQRELRSGRFYRKLEETFNRNRLSRAIFDLLFVTPSEKAPPPATTQPAEEKFERYDEMIIRNIQIKKLDLFGPTVSDTTKTSQSWLQKALNSLHISTRESVIRKNLFIEPGDEIDPLELADNERVLRRLSFIRDARIIVLPKNEASDSVDLLVIVQDVFPYTAGGRFRGLDRSSLELRNINLAGLGHEFSNRLIYDNRQVHEFGYRGIYYVPNIAGSFINGELEFAHTDLEKTTGLNLQRAFYIPEARWAGGLQHFQTTIKRNLLFQNPLSDSIFDYRFHYSDVWGAHAFPFQKERPKERGDPERRRIIVGARFSRTDFRMRPEVSPTTNHFFHDNRQYLFSIGWSLREFYRDRYLFGFGRTEDIPYGSLVNFTFGREDREFADYYYAGLSLIRGRFIPRFGYLLGLLEGGSFFRENGPMERRLVHLRSSYYSPLIEAGKYRFRQTLSIDYSYGDRRHDHEFLRIGEENIRGFNNWTQRGTQRFSFQIETISFTPLYILGFQFAGFAFADLSFLNNSTELSLTGEDFQAYGLGFRIRNENLTFNTFQVRFAIYPGIPEKGFGIRISTIPGQIFQDFLIGKPQPLPFQ